LATLLSSPCLINLLLISLSSMVAATNYFLLRNVILLPLTFCQ
jgi:hypothetical protein